MPYFEFKWLDTALAVRDGFVFFRGPVNLFVLDLTVFVRNTAVFV